MYPLGNDRLASLSDTVHASPTDTHFEHGEAPSHLVFFIRHRSHACAALNPESVAMTFGLTQALLGIFLVFFKIKSVGLEIATSILRGENESKVEAILAS